MSVPAAVPAAPNDAIASSFRRARLGTGYRNGQLGWNVWECLGYKNGILSPIGWDITPTIVIILVIYIYKYNHLVVQLKPQFSAEKEATLQEVIP